MRIVDSFDRIRPIMSRFSMLAPFDKDISLTVRAHSILSSTALYICQHLFFLELVICARSQPNFPGRWQGPQGHGRVRVCAPQQISIPEGMDPIL